MLYEKIEYNEVIKSIKNQIDDNVENIKVDLSNGRSKKCGS